MSKRTELRDKLSLAVKLIVNSQNKEGGWRYYPKKEDADISVTVCQVMALRAAHNAGIHVPKETIDDAVEYVKKCQNRDGGFIYMLSGGGESALSAFGGRDRGPEQRRHYYDRGPEITQGLDYLTQFRPEQGVTRREQYYEYGHYYAVQAMWQAGGERWARWYPAIRDELIARQGPDGSWSARPTDPNMPRPCASSSCRCPRTSCRSSSGRKGNPRYDSSPPSSLPWASTRSTTSCAASRCSSDLIDARGNACTSSKYVSRPFPFSPNLVLLAMSHRPFRGRLKAVPLGRSVDLGGGEKLPHCSFHFSSSYSSCYIIIITQTVKATTGLAPVER